MIKAKKFDIEDSNIANLGSQAEKDARYGAAESETAWHGAGKKIGIEIWRIEKFKVVAWPKEEYGKFYSGDSYIILRTYKASPDDQKLSYDLHFWIGEESSQDEYGTAAYKTVELDDYINHKEGSDPVQHREIQGHESRLFLTYFPKIEILSGGVDSGFRKVEPKEYKPRLLHVKGKKNVIVREVPIAHESLNSGDVFILDAGLTLVQMNGSKASLMEKQKGGELLRSICAERFGKPVTHIFDEGDRDAKVFWEPFGGEKTMNEAVPDEEQKSEKKMFRLSDATGKMEFTEVAPKRESLDTNDVFVFDAGFEVFVWIGKGATKEERSNGMGYATDYLFKHNRPKYLPISRVMEGGENQTFFNAFK